MRSRVSDGILIVTMCMIALTALASAMPKPHPSRTTVHVRLAQNKLHPRPATGGYGTVFTEAKPRA